VIGFAVASAAAVLGTGVHTLVGSRRVVAPLLKARDLTPPSRWLMFLCWHAVSVLLAVLAAGFAWAAWSAQARDIGLMLTALAAALALLTLYVAVRAGFRPWRLPPFVLFSLMAAAGGWSLLT